MSGLTLTGKRKRDIRAQGKAGERHRAPRAVTAKQEDGSDDEDADTSDGAQTEEQELKERFRRAFEARFQPLPEQVALRSHKTPLAEEGEGEDDDPASESEWSGISSRSTSPIQVLAPPEPRSVPRDDRRLAREYMTSRVPSTTAATPATPKTKARSAAAEATDKESAAHLANDLALQRLLSESSLLTAGADGRLRASGKARILATEKRLAALGAKGPSVFEQTKMPMAHRVGIEGKKKLREEKRRREARENGIVLEKVRRETKEVKRERGIGGQIGRFRGGTLVLGKEDVRGLVGGERGGGRRGRGRGRGMGRG